MIRVYPCHPQSSNASTMECVFERDNMSFLGVLSRNFDSRFICLRARIREISLVFLGKKASEPASLQDELPVLSREYLNKK